MAMLWLSYLEGPQTYPADLAKLLVCGPFRGAGRFVLCVCFFAVLYVLLFLCVLCNLGGLAVPRAMLNAADRSGMQQHAWDGSRELGCVHSRIAHVHSTG